MPQRPSAPVPRLRRQRGRRALPAHLPREEIRLQPTDEQLAATSGGMRKMSEERSEVLEYVQGHFKVLVYVREVWSNSMGEIVTAPVPDTVIDEGLPGPGLLIQVVISKYRDHLPLARQVQIYQRMGIELSRNTLVDWVAAVVSIDLHLADVLAQQRNRRLRTPVVRGAPGFASGIRPGRVSSGRHRPGPRRRPRGGPACA